MTRLSIVHTTAYKYKRKVRRSYNEARLTPLTDAQQVVLDSRLKVSPSQAAVGSYRDYWGSHVNTFDMQHPHSDMHVTSTSTVEVDRAAMQPKSSPLGWDEIRSDATVDAFAEWLATSPLTAVSDEVHESVAAVVDGLEPAEAAAAVMSWLRANMEYVKGVTGVTTHAEEAWQQRKGVCQDLAHLGIAALRSQGIPARYVSGYIHPVPDAAIGETVAGQSHAWLEWWDGQWHSWDPTNHKPASDLHVTVAKGRDYRDVAPVRGILSGGGGSVLTVQVHITRLT